VSGELLEMLDKAADGIAQRDTEEWAGWITYLLEALDSGLDGAPVSFVKQHKADVARTLERVRADITTRLESGRW
jgi:hypothetical protein